MPLVGVLIWFASSLVARVLLGAGLGFITFQFLTTLTENLKNAVISTVSGLPADILNVVGLLNLDMYLSIILSAMTMAAFISASKLALGKT